MVKFAICRKYSCTCDKKKSHKCISTAVQSSLHMSVVTTSPICLLKVQILVRAAHSISLAIYSVYFNIISKPTLQTKQGQTERIHRSRNKSSVALSRAKWQYINKSLCDHGDFKLDHWISLQELTIAIAHKAMCSEVKGRWMG